MTGTTEPRRYLDADSHVLEPVDWLTPYADPSIRDRMRTLALPHAPTNDSAESTVVDRAAKPNDDLLEGDNLWGKGYQAYGAWEPGERIAILDRYSIDAQLVFSTFAPGQYVSDDLDLLYGGTRAHTRALVDFCSADPRLLPVPLIPFVDLDRAVDELDFALAQDVGAILVSSRSPTKQIGPGHPALDPFWARLQDADIAFVTHVGTGGKLVPTGYRNNGRPLPPDFLGGGENIRSKDYINIGYWPENFLSCLALDGVFERFPRLRGASIEQGAEWVPGMLKKLDGAMQFARTEPDLAALPLTASDYIRRQTKFTPFAKDDVGWILDNVGADLLMFSTDFPHPEGTRDPIGRFEAHLERFDEATRHKFYVDNMVEMLGAARPAGVSVSREVGP
jgi:predicted TIM-barrel fold metal-dependent hydrolase